MKISILNSAILISSAFAQSVFAKEKPNILCVVCEDISPYLGCYGDNVAITPNLDKFATESIRYTRMFTTVGVSAPSRAALITGMYPTAIGANQMRNFTEERTQLPPNILPYEVVLPEGVKCYTEFMREAGYYCTNNDKTDYQFAAPLTAWDENGKTAHWKHRPKGKPFLSIFNLFVTHESQIWARGSKPLVVDPAKIKLPPYYPEDPIIRNDMAVMYSNIFEMDKQAQKLIDEVKEAGLLDNTIIIFYSDNGGPMPRGKRAVNESGMLVPFMVRFPNGYRKGEVDNRLSLFLDIPTTILSIAGIKPPSYMNGQAFLGEYNTKPRDYVYGARNRMDEQIDKQGAIRDSKFRYIRNYMPEKANYMPIGYRLQMPMMRRMVEMLKNDSLNDVQKLWFKAPRSKEEFYDVDKDPHEINNLINDPTYKADIDRLRKEFDKWDNKYNALWKLSELECREKFWPKGIQPMVSKPSITRTAKGLVFQSETKCASFAYQINGLGYSKNNWYLYTQPIKVKIGDIVTVIADRAGYKNSEITEYKVSR